jgi:GNAT superfamily N-acetyltransferase
MPIKIASSEDEILQCFPVIVQLRSHLTQTDFLNRVKRQQQAGYQLVYLQDDRVKAVAGFRLVDTLAHGRLLYIDDLVTDTNVRSKGYGSALLDWLVGYAESQGCGSVQLDSGTHRSGAHRFYFSKGMEIGSFRFILRLSS